MLKKKMINPTGQRKNPDMSGVGISNNTISAVVKPAINTTVTHPKFFNGKPVIMSQLFIDVKNTIPVTHYYVDSMGDLCMSATHDGVKYIICETSDVNQAIELANNPFENGSVTYSSNTTATRAPRITIPTDATEICEISLGSWRNYISKIEGIDNIVVGKRIYYDKTTNERKDKDNGNTTFVTCLLAKGDVIECTNKLKDILKKYPKIAVDWR